MRIFESVAVSGNRVVLGAPSGTYAWTSPGVAVVFANSGGTWTQEAKLTASDGAAADGFGDSNTVVVGAPQATVNHSTVAISGNTVAAGTAPYPTETCATTCVVTRPADQGHAYLYSDRKPIYGFGFESGTGPR